MREYLDLLKRILDEGEDIQSGAILKSEDRKPVCRTLLASQLRFDLRQAFPICTTKNIPFDVVVDEVFWFLRGQTNIRDLGRVVQTPVPQLEQEVLKRAHDETFVQRHIWDSWADETGNVPHIYGAQWRAWPYPKVWPDEVDVADGPLVTIRHFDQVAELLTDLRAVVADPGNRARRRIMLSAWNAPLVKQMGLPPCHTLSQWLPVNGHLDCVCHWRSIDMFTGCPFNVVQYALLAHIFGRLAGLKPRHLVCTIADCHLYDNQYEQVKEQLAREPRELPQLVIHPKFFTTCADLSIRQMLQADPTWFTLDGYEPHRGKLRAEVAV